MAALLLFYVMALCQEQLGTPEPPKPCEMFDLIAGTGTGGCVEAEAFHDMKNYS
jgi:hypothetical protein